MNLSELLCFVLHKVLMCICLPCVDNLSFANFDPTLWSVQRSPWALIALHFSRPLPTYLLLPLLGATAFCLHLSDFLRPHCLLCPSHPGPCDLSPWLLPQGPELPALIVIIVTYW